MKWVAIESENRYDDHGRRKPFYGKEQLIEWPAIDHLYRSPGKALMRIEIKPMVSAAVKTR